MPDLKTQFRTLTLHSPLPKIRHLFTVRFSVSLPAPDRLLRRLVGSLPLTWSSEINPPDPRSCTGAASYCYELKRAGWEQIGEGVGGRVFHRPGDPEVVKVSDGDDCYLAFVDYVVTNPQSCLPALKVVHRPGQWAVIHIEFLDPLSVDNAAALNLWWNAILTAWRTKGPLPSPKNWSEVANALRPVAIEGKCGFDMKEVNAMQRGSTVVFTDPLN